ncbi:MAG TPA: inositol monophosphatase family protein [Hyphomicrobiaceae bacterium]|nr:inositol monophosphatase family protein [Hyphomicrobiaceae bacterium]
MTDLSSLLALLRDLQRAIRDAVVDACERQSVLELGAVAEDGPGDTIYQIDKVSESMLLERLEPEAARLGGVVLVAEGLPGGELVLPRGRSKPSAWRFIVDPIDGTRGIMYQKRSAWVLGAVAPNRGEDTRLGDIVVAAQTEIPTQKQHLSDELWAVRGRGAHLQRYNRLTHTLTTLPVRPSRADSLRHGYAMLTRFFPGARDELAAIDEEVMLELLGASPEGKALCFEDQYASTGGQLYELAIGHDRFNADLRPLMHELLQSRGQPSGLCCHPYDICTALIAEEAGVLLTDPWGGPLDVPLDIWADVAWVGYANSSLRRQVEPVLQAALARRRLRPERGRP